MSRLSPALRHLVMARDGAVCRVCGVREGVTIHHITPHRHRDRFRHVSHLWNLIVLCPVHHERADRWYVERARRVRNELPAPLWLRALAVTAARVDPIMAAADTARGWCHWMPVESIDGILWWTAARVVTPTPIETPAAVRREATGRERRQAKRQRERRNRRWDGSLRPVALTSVHDGVY